MGYSLLSGIFLQDEKQFEVLLAIAEAAYKRALKEDDQEDVKYWKIRLNWIKRIIKKR
jgi:hypothetical protein